MESLVPTVFFLGNSCPGMMYRGETNDEEGEAALKALFPDDGGAFLDAGTVDADMMDVELAGKCQC